MKKKIFFGVATMFFAVATMFNMNIVQSSSAGDVSLESIMIMQKAQAEFRINPPWEKVCHPNLRKCTWRMISDNKSCTHDMHCW
ncbi:MAG: hypothetical protein GX905_04810 [Bacteroidales bacterium]|nr:hypothetical protein [Bacteroidales bacterium]